MRRRKFIALLAGAAAACPLAARAQQRSTTTRRLGLLFPQSAQAARGMPEAFTRQLKEYGWIEGQNISLEYRFADGKEVLRTAKRMCCRSWLRNWFSRAWT
jgi:putative tryptophan/tyrosine transport system substrate-binding protein